MSDVSVIALLFRVVISLGVVLVLLWLAARFLGQGGLSRGLRPRGLPIEVVARHTLGRRASIALVRAGGRGLVLGVTDAHVTVLAETDPDDLVVIPVEAPGTAPSATGITVPASSPWKAVVEAVRDKTVRRS